MFDLSNRRATDIFRDTTNIPETDPVSHAKQIQSLEGKSRTLDIAEHQLKLANRLTKLEKLILEGENLGLENAIVIENGNALGAQLQQAQAKTQVELAKLAGLQHDVRGYRGLAGLNGRKWDIQLKQMELELELQQQNLAALEAQASYIAPTNGKKLNPFRL